MKNIALWTAGALVGGALAMGCVGQEQAPVRQAYVRTAPVRPAPPTLTTAQPQPGVTRLQQPAPPPPVATEVPQQQAPQGPGVNVAPPAYAEENPYGATEPQPAQPPSYGAPSYEAPGTAPYAAPDDHARISQALTAAAQQIQRLERLQASAPEGRRPDVDAALADLYGGRERVLQDVRAVEMQQGNAPGSAHAELQRDVARLESALRASYAVIPPPEQGYTR